MEHRSSRYRHLISAAWSSAFHQLPFPDKIPRRMEAPRALVSVWPTFSNQILPAHLFIREETFYIKVAFKHIPIIDRQRKKQCRIRIHFHWNCLPGHANSLPAIQIALLKLYQTYVPASKNSNSSRGTIVSIFHLYITQEQPLTDPSFAILNLLEKKALLLRTASPELRKSWAK